MISTLLTFDYELFLGSESGQIENSLIIPTERILKILDKKMYRGIFFVDTVYLLKMRNESKKYSNLKDDFDKISKQLRQIYINHEIYLHIHPHWLDAIYDVDNKSWDLSNHAKYKGSSIDPSLLNEIFSDSIELLKVILKDPNFVSVGYRAGGWCIQPFSSFRQVFDNHNIYKDYSVIPGLKISSDVIDFDFLSSPKKNIYQFDECPSLEKKTGKFTEIPISTYPIMEPFYSIYHLCEKIFFKLGFRFGKKRKGTTVSMSQFKKTQLYPRNVVVAQIETLNYIKCISILIALFRSKYMHFVSHPKLMTKLDFYFLRVISKISKSAIEK